MRRRDAPAAMRESRLPHPRTIMATTQATQKEKPAKPYAVRSSGIHGRGVFATREIRRDERIIEYKGKRSTWDEAMERPDSDPDDPAHTFLFEIDDGRVIDARVRGNAARWINHSCAPNCITQEDERGRVYIEARRRIEPGEELTYDYRLTVDDPLTRKERAAYACRCGSKKCRGTLLRLPLGGERVLRRLVVDGAERHAARHDLAVRNPEVAAHDAVVRVVRGLRDRVQAVCAGGDHHALHEHPEVEPAPALQVAVEREEQRHRRAEERVVLAVLRMRALALALADAHHAVVRPAERPPAREIRVAPLLRVIRVLLAVLRGTRGPRIVRGHEVARQRIADRARGHVHLPRLAIGARRRTRGKRQDAFDHAPRHGRRKKTTHRAARQHGAGDALAAERHVGRQRRVLVHGERHQTRAAEYASERRMTSPRRSRRPAPKVSLVPGGGEGWGEGQPRKRAITPA